MEENLFEQRIDLTQLSKAVTDIRSEIGRVIVGQYKMVDLLMMRWTFVDRRCTGCRKNTYSKVNGEDH